MPAFDADYWDERYRSRETVWGGAPNRFVERELADLSAGRALDLACGEGRNAIWLAGLGWDVIAVDFSAVAVEKGRAGERSELGTSRIDWRVADALTFVADEPVDLVLLCYLQVPPPQRRAAVSRAAAALREGGTVLVIAHDSRNITDGTGGPQDPTVLYTAADVAGDLAGRDLAGSGLVVDRAGEELRPVAGADRPAIDCLLRAHRPRVREP